MKTWWEIDLLEVDAEVVKDIESVREIRPCDHAQNGRFEPIEFGLVRCESLEVLAQIRDELVERGRVKRAFEFLSHGEHGKRVEPMFELFDMRHARCFLLV